MVNVPRNLRHLACRSKRPPSRPPSCHDLSEVSSEKMPCQRSAAGGFKLSKVPSGYVKIAIENGHL